MRLMTLQQLGEHKGQFVLREFVKDVCGDDGVVITPIGDYVEAYLMKDLGVVCYLPHNPVTGEVRPCHGYVLEVHTSRIHPGVENVEFRVSGPATAQIMEGRSMRDFLRLRPFSRSSLIGKGKQSLVNWFALAVNGEVYGNTTRQKVEIKHLETAA